MKKHRVVGNSLIPMIAALFSLSALILPTGTVHAATIADCSGCHGLNSSDWRPLDNTSSRVVASGAFVGNHQTHLPASAKAANCAVCHGGAVSTYTNAHRDGFLQMTSNVNASPAKGAYSKPSGFAQTATPTLGTCSNVNCHFEKTTPTWGTTTVNCSTCHDALPSTLSHTKHIAAAGGGAGSCVSCHPAHATFQHASSAGNAARGVDVNKGTYTGSNFLYLPSQSALRVTGSCTTATCHDDGTGNTVESPFWGEAVAPCSSCHQSRPATGSHLAHLQSGSSTACASCHAGTVEAATAPSTHLNNLIDINAKASSVSLTKAKGSPYTTCTTSSCHVDPSSVSGIGGTPVQKISPTWGDATQPQCTYCHPSTPTTGSHTAHFNAGFTACANCHKGAVQGTTAPVEHVDGNIDVYKTASNDLGYGLNKAIGSPYATCTGSCHEDGRGTPVTSPNWGTSNNDCSACHAKRPPTGSHLQHIGVGVVCSTCHKGAVEATSAPVQHMDGNIDVFKTNPGDGGYPIDKAKNSPYLACSNTACHGTTSTVWGGNTTAYQCTKCHGKPTPLANYSTVDNRQAAPGYDSVGVGTAKQTGIITSDVSNDPKVGAHDAHMRSRNNIGKPTNCTDCHVVPATAFVAGHMNGISTPVFSKYVKNQESSPGSNLPFTWTVTGITSTYLGGQCSNTYCHGSTLNGGTNTTPSWTDGNYLTGTSTDCGKCHGAPPLAGRVPHAPESTACSTCHPHNGSRTSTDPLLGSDFHMNGKIEANKFCDACHDYDTRGTNGTIWGKNAMEVEGYGAHAMHINYLKKRMNVTTMNPNVDGFGSANYNGICGVCHSKLEANHSQANRDAPRTINFGESTVRQFGPNPPIYNGVKGVSSATTAKTCSNIDCHYKTSPIWSPF